MREALQRWSVMLSTELLSINLIEASGMDTFTHFFQLLHLPIFIYFDNNLQHLTKTNIAFL